MKIDYDEYSGVATATWRVKEPHGMARYTMIAYPDSADRPKIKVFCDWKVSDGVYHIPLAVRPYTKEEAKLDEKTLALKVLDEALDVFKPKTLQRLFNEGSYYPHIDDMAV